MKGRLGNVELTAPVETAAIAAAHERTRGESLRSVAPSTLRRSPWQPRSRVDVTGEDFAALVESIRERGVLEPLLVREVPGGLELLAGGRRLEASRKAGLAVVPVRVLVGLDDVDAREVALVENLARKDLAPWEEAQGLAALAGAREKAGREVSVRKLAFLAGRSKSAVARALQIAEGCTEEVRKVAGGAAVPSWDTFPAEVLLSIAKGQSVAERAALLRQVAGSYHGTPAEAKPLRRKRAEAPPALSLHGDATAGHFAFTLRRTPATLTKADARAALAALEPLVRALRVRVK